MKELSTTINWNKMKNAKRWVSNRTLRKWRYGCNPEDTWSLDYNLAGLILPRLKAFKELKNNYPGMLTVEEWDATLDRMIVAFDLLWQDGKGYWEWAYLDDEVLVEGNWRKVNLGLDEFRKWYFDLWW